MRNTFKRTAAALLALMVIGGYVPFTGVTGLPDTSVVVSAEGTQLEDISETTPQTDESSSMKYDVQSKGFNVYGKFKDEFIKSTYSNYGYASAVQIGEGEKQRLESFKYGKLYTIDGVQVRITADLAVGGSAVAIKYELYNTTDVAVTAKFGSSADTQIGSNDRALVVFENDGIRMEDTDSSKTTYGAKLLLLPGDNKPDTMWLGHYSYAYNNMFNNTTDTSYSGDSGIAWSWTADIPAGSGVSRTVYMALGNFDTYTVTYDPANGEGTYTRTTIGGELAIEPADPTWEGHNFLRWVDETGAPYTFSTPVTGDITVTAEWEALDQYTVTFDTNGGDEVEPQNVYDGGNAKAPDVSKEGRTLLYWLDEEGNEFDFSTPITGDITLTAVWDKNSVTFDAGEDAESPEEQEVDYGSTAAEPETPVREGYRFICWTADPDTGEEYDFSTEIKSDVTLTAVWEALEYYTVTFDSDGGTEVEAQQVAEDGTASKPADPSKEGMTFAYWSADGETEYDFSEPVTEDITLIAVWKVTPSSYTADSAEWQQGSTDDAVIVFTRSYDDDKAIDFFTGEVYVDDELVSEDSYTAEAGSIKISFKASYLDTLAVGEHDVKVMVDDPALNEEGPDGVYAKLYILEKEKEEAPTAPSLDFPYPPTITRTSNDTPAPSLVTPIKWEDGTIKDTADVPEGEGIEEVDSGASIADAGELRSAGVAGVIATLVASFTAAVATRKKRTK